jgi:hypothetical protein
MVAGMQCASVRGSSGLIGEGSMRVNFDSVIDFGGIDADADPLLEQCFESHQAYIDARSHARTVILGRKGSGKTAIFRNLLKIKESNTFSVGHLFSEYPWHHHAKQRQTGVPDEHCFVNSWEYLIPTALDIDRRPLAASDRADAVWVIDQPVPSLGAGLEDSLIAVPDTG